MSEASAAVATGGCYCGRVEYEATLPAKFVGICHCQDCRDSTGGPFVCNFAVEGSKFKITKGEGTPDLGSFSKPKEGGKTHMFCKNCGTRIGARAADDSIVVIGVATVKAGGEDLKPQFHIQLAEKAPWYELPDDSLPRFDRWPTA